MIPKVIVLMPVFNRERFIDEAIRNAIELYLRRAVRDDEIAALITLWRRDGELGMATTADDILWEERFAGAW